MAGISPLRRRMIEDMTVRNLSPATQRSYLAAVSKLSRYFGRSPDRLGLEDVRAFQVHLVAIGMSWPALESQGVIPVVASEGLMRPKERRDTGQGDLLRSRLDQIIDMDHPLVKLGRTIDWGFLEQRFGAVYEDGPGRPPLPTRLWRGWPSSSTPTISPTRSCASAGSRTPITSSSAARSSFSTSWSSIARP